MNNPMAQPKPKQEQLHTTTENYAILKGEFKGEHEKLISNEINDQWRYCLEKWFCAEFAPGR